MTEKQLSQEQQIQALLDRESFHLRFTRHIERRFQRYYASKYYKYMRMALLVASVLFLSTLLFDHFYASDWRMAILIRLGIAGPALLLLIVVAFTPGFVHITQLIMSLSALVFTLAVVIIAYLLPDPIKELYYDMTILIVIYAFSLARLQFRNACIVGVLILLMFNLTLYVDRHIHLEILLLHNFLLLVAAIFSLLNNYLMERSSRLEFLQAKLLQLEKQGLQAANIQLKGLASLDSLTNIANRRTFNTAIEDEWRRAQRQHYPLALMMIDVDYFKEYNDSYGHQQGDDCLQQIARLLAKQTRRPGDLAARYGGDEFILLFSNTDAEEAKQIAKRFRQAVRDLAITNKYSRAGDVVTLTIGIASLVPEDHQQPTELLNQADNALYQGKVQGRNCVVVFEEQEVEC